MAEIALTRGYAALIDDQDAETISRFKWRAHVANGGVYAVRWMRKAEGSGFVYMHRQIAGTPPGFETDHRNGNTLDNRRDNLRVATKSQNQFNRGAVGGRRLKGVRFDAARTSRKKWCAKIEYEGRGIHLGCYLTEEEAACAYDRAASALGGEFARLNFGDRAQHLARLGVGTPVPQPPASVGQQRSFL